MLAQTRAALSDENISRALRETGAASVTAENIALVRDTLWSEPYPTGLHLRKGGRRMTLSELRANRIHASTICSHELFEALSTEGKANPIEAAQSIVTAVMNWQANANKVERSREAGLSMVQVYANVMAAGPCAACIALAAKPVPLSEAPLGPLAECPHPDQCRLHFRAVLTFD